MKDLPFMKRAQTGLYCALFIAIALLLSGCSTIKVNVNVNYPPQYDIPRGKSLAVLGFKTLNTLDRTAGEKISQSLVAYLSPSGYYNLIERSRIAQVIEEQKFSDTDFVDSSKVTHIGKILDVDYIIIGEVTAYSVEVDSGYEQKQETYVTGRTLYDGYGNPFPEIGTRWIQVPWKMMRGSVAVNFRMVNVDTAQILVADNPSKNFSSNKAVGTNNIGRLPAIDTVRTDLTRFVVNQFAEKIAPHIKTETRILQKSKTPGVKAGIEQARGHRWQDAIRTWENAKGANPADPAIFHNLGVGYELINEFDKAAESMRQATSMGAPQKYYFTQQNKIDYRRNQFNNRKNK